MRLRLFFLVSVATLLRPLFAADAPADNPLFTESPLPLHYPQFDRIRPEHFGPAYTAAMAEQVKEIDAITSSKEPATFENTIVAFDASGRFLSRVDNIFSNLTSADTNPALQQLEQELAPKQAAHEDAIHANAALFARIKSVYERRATLGLDPESLHLVERIYRDFVRGGANLAPADQAKLKALNAEIASVETTFSQNVQKEKNADGVLVDSRAELAGLSESEIGGAAEAARAAGHEGKFLLALQNTTGQPVLATLQNRALRERVMQASLARGSHGGPYDNRAVVTRLARLRAERANLLGYPNHAAYQLAEQTIGSVDAVNQLLAQLAVPAVANAKFEVRNQQLLIDREHAGFQVTAADWGVYSDKVRRILYRFNTADVRPYFELNHVLLDGVFYAATRLYGITFKERHDLPVYNPDVRVFDVFNADGSQLAIFLVDYYARPSKRGGAWMNQYVYQSGLFGTKPVVANHLNIPKPAAGQPTLLTIEEVRTAFHEFGHALHGMFSDVRYPRFAGTRVPRDFVEFPSQVNEMWRYWPEVLQHYARHYQTGEPMPAALLKRVLDAENFNQGYDTTELVAANAIDQAWHQLKPSEVPDDVAAFEAAALHRAGVDYPPVPPRYRSTYFSHSFGGSYSAGYYSYFWSEVLAADSVEWFKAHGGLNRASGDHFRATVLSRGGSRDARELFRNFTGAEPDVKPLIRRRGLDHPPAALEFDG